MAYSPIDQYDAKVQIDNDRARARKAAQKATSHKASVSRVPAAAAATTATSSSFGSAGPSSSTTPPKSATLGRPAWRRSNPSSSSNFSPSSMNRRASSRANAYEFAAAVDHVYDDAADEDHPELDHSTDDGSASETEHDAPVESWMPTSYESLLARPYFARDTTSRPEYSPPKYDQLVALADASSETAPKAAERFFDEPSFGLNGSAHWHEAEEEDGYACWTAYADERHTSAVIVVRECRW